MLRIIGYSPKACTKILNKGYRKIPDLSEVIEDHFVCTLEKCAKQHKKVSFTSCGQFKLLVAYFYSTTCRRHGNIPSAQEIASCGSYMKLSGMYMSAKDSKKSGNNSNKPPKFKAGTSFVKWQKLAEAYLWSITNSSGIP